MKNTLNVGRISEGFVLDHIEAGKSMDIYKYLHLDKLDCCVAIIKNARSSKMGKKDIMKIECPIDFMDLDILGFIDHNITVNIISNEQVVDKKILRLPKEITNVIRCKNPRCITSIEQELDHIFVLTDEENQVYRCKYCEESIPEDKQKNKRERGFYRSRSRYLSQNSMAVYVPHLNITDTILLWSAGYLPPARSPAIASDWSYLLPSESLPDV